MKILLSRADGAEKSKVNTGCEFDYGPAVKFLAAIFESSKEFEDKEAVK